ncbi:probable ubiquitin-conjugating enzyme E2 26 isoform X2 [Momordica charantia]|nr:probable ubiquitin-conjugating enzyme E2 26 isoform X2 [Momordica charantia]
MKPQVLRHSPLINRPPKMLKNKGIQSVEVIDVDKDEDFNNVIYIHDGVENNDKGKGIYHNSDHELQEMMASPSYSPDVEILEGGNEVESAFPSAQHNVIDLDNHYSDSSNGDEWIPFDEIMDVDEYSALQAHFDHMDIPPDIEAPIPWLPHGQNRHKSIFGTSSSFAESQINPGSVNQLGNSPAHAKLKATLANSLNLQAEIDIVNHPPEGTEPFTSFTSQDVLPNKKSVASRYRDKSGLPHEVINSLLGAEAAKTRWFSDPFKRKKKLHGSNNISINQSDSRKLHNNGGETSSDTSETVKKQFSSNNMSSFNFPAYMDNIYYPPGAGASLPHWPDYAKMKTKELVLNPPSVSDYYGPFDHLIPPHPLHPPTLGEVVDMPWIQGSTRDPANLAPDNSTLETISIADLDEIMRKFEQFKRFDTVDDHSDHHYTSKGFTMKQLPKKWTKRIQEEWKILEKDLPDTIFVRAYESRMDLLRAVIIGAEGTPYHDGLFFFDIFFPMGYPDVPPLVYYHSGGLRLNPNLYNCGKVCLSLLNTWSGSGNERWIPGMSTMLQVLVSIQGLILNTKPYFNEPGFANQNGSVAGENRSQQYNEETYLLSMKTMVYNIRRPPKHFEDFVKGHFFKRAHDILVSCKAYMDGAQVGSLVKGGVQDLDLSDKCCSNHFKQSLSQYLSMLVKTFQRMGVGDCEKFLLPPPSLPVSSAKKRSGRHSELKIESLNGDGATEKLVLG